MVKRINATLAATDPVTQQKYNEYVAQYEEFLQFPRTTPIESLDQNYLYVIRNAFYDDYVARLDANGTVYPSKVVSGSKIPSNALWYVVKANNAIYIISKAGDKGTAVYPVREGITVNTVDADHSSSRYAWQARTATTTNGRSGMSIVDESGRFGWFAQPANFKTIVLKPAGQNGGVWTFEKTDFTVGIQQVRANAAKVSGQRYDLLGRPAGAEHHGIVIESDGTKHVR